MNPEFLRNIWLEFSPTRITAMALVLAAIFLLAAAQGWDMGFLSNLSVGLFYLIAGLWGTRRAAAAVPDEITGGTWDAQRMSALGAWTMTWGKLFGSAAFVWCGALACLAVSLYAESRLGGTLPEVAAHGATLALTVLTGQAVAMAVSLLVVAKNRASRHVRVTLSQFVGIVVIWTLATSDVLQDNTNISVLWYDREAAAASFTLASTAAFAGWALLGCYRFMRGELLFRRMPWAWPAFTLFMMVYLAGFFREFGMVSAERLGVAFLVGLLMVYAAVLGDSKDPVGYRRLFARARDGDWRRALETFPNWAVGLILAALVGFCSLVVAKPLGITDRLPSFLQGVSSIPSEWDFRPQVIAAFLFLCRDLCLIHLFARLAGARRNDTAWLLLLVVLYGILPAAFAAFGWFGILAFFVPYPGASAVLAVLAPLGETVFLGLILFRMVSSDRIVSDPTS